MLKYQIKIVIFGNRQKIPKSYLFSIFFLPISLCIYCNRFYFALNFGKISKMIHDIRKLAFSFSPLFAAMSSCFMMIIFVIIGLTR